MATILLFVNFVAANLLEKLTEMTLTGIINRDSRLCAFYIIILYVYMCINLF